MRRCSVSMPCSSRNALNGESAAPVSRRPWTRALRMNASGPNACDIREAVVRRVGLGEVLEAAGSGPVELAGVDDDAADGGAVAAEELGGGVDHDVGAPLDGPHQRRRGAGVVDDQRQAVLVGDGGELLDVGHVELGIAERLGVDGAGLVVDGGANAVEVVGVDEADVDAQPRQRVVEQVVGAAVERCGGDDLVAGGGQGGDGQGFRRLAGGRRQSRRAAFERGHALLEDVGGGVHDARVDVAELLQREQPAGMVGILKQVRRGLVDGHGARAGGGIGRLAGMNGEGGKLLLLPSDM